MLRTPKANPYIYLTSHLLAGRAGDRTTPSEPRGEIHSLGHAQFIVQMGIIGWLSGNPGVVSLLPRNGWFVRENLFGLAGARLGQATLARFVPRYVRRALIRMGPTNARFSLEWQLLIRSLCF